MYYQSSIFFFFPAWSKQTNDDNEGIIVMRIKECVYIVWLIDAKLEINRRPLQFVCLSLFEMLYTTNKSTRGNILRIYFYDVRTTPWRKSIEISSG